MAISNQNHYTEVGVLQMQRVERSEKNIEEAQSIIDDLNKQTQ
jgi:hypothetical protein